VTLVEPALVVGGRPVDLSRPLLMGIVNATPDSFSDSGVHDTAEARVRLAVDQVAQGAHVIDVGGQSGITGVPEVPVEEEIARVVPVVAGLHEALPDVLISVDTYRPAVVEAALEAGAAIVNDVSGLLYPEVAALVAGAGAGLVIMHTRARPKHKVLDDDLYAAAGGVTADVVAFLRERIETAVGAGLPETAIVLDPGPDFAKTPAQTVEVLRRLDDVRTLRRPLLHALSRKDFVGAVTRRPPRERLAGTLAAVGHVLGHPGTILRVHDVAEVADYLAVADVLAGRTDLPADTRLHDALRRQAPRARARAMTPDDLVEIAQIHELKYRYVRFMDTKQWDDLAELFTPDATASYGGGATVLEGRDAIIGFLRGAMADEDMLTSHKVHHPEITLVGPDAATGVWALDDVVILGSLGMTVRGASYYDDRYERRDGAWRIAHTGYKRVYEEIEPRPADLRLTASWWGTGGRSSLQ
jgi:dihydropteroate synthase